MSKSRVPNRIRVEVTEQDIARAKVNDSYLCVVAQAIARTIPTAHHIEVDTQAIRFTVDDERRVHLTPYAVQGYVIAFDAGEDIQPFSFQIDRPQITRRRRFTDVGKAAERARTNARRDAVRDAVRPSNKGRTAKTKSKAADPNAAARAAYAAVTDAHPGEPLSTGTGRKPPPRVFRKRRRAYGHRLLRINQEAID